MPISIRTSPKVWPKWAALTPHRSSTSRPKPRTLSPLASTFTNKSGKKPWITPQRPSARTPKTNCATGRFGTNRDSTAKPCPTNMCVQARKPTFCSKWSLRPGDFTAAPTKSAIVTATVAAFRTSKPSTPPALGAKARALSTTQWVATRDKRRLRSKSSRSTSNTRTVRPVSVATIRSIRCSTPTKRSWFAPKPTLVSSNTSKPLPTSTRK